MVLALLSRQGPRNCWSLAEQAGEARPWGMQHLLARAVWDTDAVAGELRAFVVDHLGAADGILVVDETGDLNLDPPTEPGVWSLSGEAAVVASGREGAAGLPGFSTVIPLVGTDLAVR